MSGSGDLKPSPEEIERNRDWLETELVVLRPEVVLALGLEAARVFLERYAGRRVRRLADIVATPIACRVANRDVPMLAVHHPAGAYQHPSSRGAYERASGHVRHILGLEGAS